MRTRVTPSAPHRTSKGPLAGSRVMARLAARRRAVRGEQRLARALAGDFGPGVQADVRAAQGRLAAQQQAAA